MSFSTVKTNLNTEEANRSIARAISLHIYANTIDKCEVYNEADKCFEKKYVFYVN